MRITRFPEIKNLFDHPEYIYLLNELMMTLEYILPTLNKRIGQAAPKAEYLRAGMLAYADGTNWNPVFGKGLHIYDGSAWRQLNGLHDRGDAADYDKTSWTTDGTWCDWDLSSIVPAGTKTILLRLRIQDDAAGSVIAFRKNGNSNTYVASSLTTQAANITNNGTWPVPCDSDRIIEYNATNTTWTAIQAVVLGWWL